MSFQDDNQAKLKRIEDCRELYLEHGGRRHELIERDMRARGHADFHRRILYSRFERGHHRAGWIERYGFGTGAQASRLQGRDSGLTPSPTAPVTPPKGGGVAGGDACAPGDFDEFQSWLKSVSPSMTWSWKHQVYIYKRLRRVTGGECKRLMIFLPPRHAKSELVTVRYAAWRLKKDPSMNVIVGSYNQGLA